MIFYFYNKILNIHFGNFNNIKYFIRIRYVIKNFYIITFSDSYKTVSNKSVVKENVLAINSAKFSLATFLNTLFLLILTI